MTGLLAGAIGALRALTPRAWLAIAAIGLLILVFSLGGRCARDEADADRVRDQLKVERRNAGATSRAGDERLSDTLDVHQLEKDLTDAVEALPVHPPSPRRQSLACQRLRNDGVDLRTVPACAGSAPAS